MAIHCVLFLLLLLRLCRLLHFIAHLDQRRPAMRASLGLPTWFSWSIPHWGGMAAEDDRSTVFRPYLALPMSEEKRVRQLFKAVGGVSEFQLPPQHLQELFFELGIIAKGKAVRRALLELAPIRAERWNEFGQTPPHEEVKASEEAADVAESDEEEEEEEEEKAAAEENVMVEGVEETEEPQREEPSAAAERNTGGKEGGTAPPSRELGTMSTSKAIVAAARPSRFENVLYDRFMVWWLIGDPRQWLGASGLAKRILRTRLRLRQRVRQKRQLREGIPLLSPAAVQSDVLGFNPPATADANDGTSKAALPHEDVPPLRSSKNETVVH